MSGKEGIILKLLDIPERLRRRLRTKSFLRQLGGCGKRFIFTPTDRIFDPANIFLGDNVYIGPGAFISIASPSKLRIGNGVLFGPHLMIVGGDHLHRVVGQLMCDIKEGFNEGVISIEDDVWCGANVTILKQVCIGEGAVVGAGSLVTRSLPPYTVCMGHPCRPVSPRFTDAELTEHLHLLGRNEEDIEKMIARRTAQVDPQSLQD